MMGEEGWGSKDDGPNWGCLAITAVLAVIWMAILVAFGVF